MPHSRPMPSIGTRCHEVRINGVAVTWRIVYRADPDAVVIADVFKKISQQTPQSVLAGCQRRLKENDDA